MHKTSISHKTDYVSRTEGTDQKLFETVNKEVYKPGIQIRNLRKIYNVGIFNKSVNFFFHKYYYYLFIRNKLILPQIILPMLQSFNFVNLILLRTLKNLRVSEIFDISFLKTVNFNNKHRVTF